MPKYDVYRTGTYNTPTRTIEADSAEEAIEKYDELMGVTIAEGTDDCTNPLEFEEPEGIEIEEVK